MSINWAELRAELAIWRSEERVLPVWWRDDDAITHTPQLERLADGARTHDMPLHIAVIPEPADESLLPFLEPGPLRAVVHGWAHQNHAPADQKKSEFGTPRPAARSDAAAGLRRLRELFGDKAHAMFVPPWNRVAPEVITALPDMGYRWISTFLPRAAAQAAPGLMQINTHIDPVDWRSTRGLADPDMVLGKLVAHLQDRRCGEADGDEPLGLLTHHLMQDNATWAFCDALFQELRAISLQPFDIAMQGTQT